MVLGSGRKKKNVPAFYGSFSLLRRGDKKSHDHELVIEFLFRIFKQFADKRRITKKLVFPPFEDPHLILLRYLFAKMFRYVQNLLY